MGGLGFLGGVCLWVIGAAGASPAPGQVEVLLSQPFTLAQPYAYTWSQPQTHITTGTIVVVIVHPEDATVRQVGGPVLYAGAVPAERANNGDLDGRIIAFVPGFIDLDAEPLYWGPPTLPERVDATSGAATRAKAPPPNAARATTAPRLDLADAAALYRRLADLIDVHAPSEPERARGYRGQ
jgi:hypothetical protein